MNVKSRVQELEEEIELKKKEVYIQLGMPCSMRDGISVAELQRKIPEREAELKGWKDAMRDELDFLTHIIWGKDGENTMPTGDVILDGALMMSAISPFASKVVKRIEYLKEAINET